jgi:hypothetical protein
MLRCRRCISGAVGTAIRASDLRRRSLAWPKAYPFFDFPLPAGAGCAKAEATPDFAFSAADFFGFFASLLDRICPLAMIVSSGCGW